MCRRTAYTRRPEVWSAALVSSWILLLVSIGYAALLFGVAWWGDRRPLYPDRPWLRPVVYSLALAVYCSSWTFYGAVGSAVRNGIGYLPIYLGPLLLLLFGWRIIERLALISRSQNTVSIADFISSRYGRSRRLAALVTVIALIGVVPYLALQYKAVALSLGVLTGQGAGNTGFFTDPALYVALLMALFAALFGTRQVDATEHHHGMMLAIALESLIKLLAMIALGVFAYLWLGGKALHVGQSARTLFENAPPVGFFTQTLLGFLAIVCLPRQFHVAVVECSDVGDIRKARWLFGIYLVLISVMVVPIAAAGVAMFGGGGAGSDTFVLALPLTAGNNALALVAYVGGFSAATGMVIVASIALATMVSNDLVMPVLLRRGWAERHAEADVATRVLWIRRIAILMLALCAYLYYRSSSNDNSLASYGLVAFVAVAQFAPGLIGGLYWRGASRRGVEIGMLVGFAVWIYTLLLPSLSASGWLGPEMVADGSVQHPLAAPAAAVQPDRLGSADPRHVLVAAAQHRGDDAGVGALASERRRAFAHRPVPGSVCAAPDPGRRRMAGQRAYFRPAVAGRTHRRRAPCAPRLRRAGGHPAARTAARPRSPTAPGCNSPNACWPHRSARRRRDWC